MGKKYSTAKKKIYTQCSVKCQNNERNKEETETELNGEREYWN